MRISYQSFKYVHHVGTTTQVLDEPDVKFRKSPDETQANVLFLDKTDGGPLLCRNWGPQVGLHVFTVRLADRWAYGCS